jgi:2-polyprenyl-6-hydroxyphenyl methylase/3-demethylubiquinone-9 3-methyltransferase
MADAFAFGKNWLSFLRNVNESSAALSTKALESMLGNVANRTFIDVGCGSGLSSLAAHRLGAIVRSFDYDRQCVECTRELQRRFGATWPVEQGSVLDRQFLSTLGQFDIVYSWGVLHHTGSMWDAIDNVTRLVAPAGRLFIAIYNDQGRLSKKWLRIKERYNRFPEWLRWTVVLPVFVRFWAKTLIRDTLAGRPFRSWRQYSETYRGMNPWRDVIDWVGGYPFEVAKPEEIFEFAKARGFQLEKMTTCGIGHGCNEFVFVRQQ